MDAEKTGKLIKELRTEKGLTQKELASLLKVSPTAVSKWENGRNLPDISMLEPLAEALGVSIYELVMGKAAGTAAAAASEGKEAKENDADTAIRSIITESIVQKKKSGRRHVISTICGILLIGLFLQLLATSLRLRQNAMLHFGPWGVEGVWISEDQDLVILSRKKRVNDYSAVKCDVEMWLLQDHEWLPCHLDYDSSMKAFLFRTGIDVWGDKPFFTSGIRTGIGKIVLKAPRTTIGKEADDWLRDRKKIVIRLESRTVPDDPASILEPLLSGIAQ